MSNYNDFGIDIETKNYNHILNMFGSDLNLVPKKNDNEKLLLESVKYGNINNISKVIDRGVDINYIDLEGHSALSLASIFNNDPKVVELLVQKGASIDTRCGKGGFTPLMLACLNNENPMVVIKLLELGADTSIESNQGYNAIGATVIEHSVTDNIFIIEQLIAYGANINSPNCVGITPLLNVCACGNRECIEILIELGADTTAMCHTGQTMDEYLDSNWKLSESEKSYLKIRKLFK